MKIEEFNNSINCWSWKKKILKRNSYIFHKNLYNAFERGINELKDCYSKESLVSDDMVEFDKFVKDKYDVIIAGSDELWKVDSIRGFPNPYWLIGDLGCKKYTYAVSSRSKFFDLPYEKYRVIEEAINDFEHISTRDQHTYCNVNKCIHGDTSISLNCDPSFLYDLEVKNDFFRVNNYGDKSKKNIVIMLEDDIIAKKIRKQLNSKYNLFSVFEWHKGYVNLPDLTPFEWLSLISSADLVITSFFHGVCFSLMKNVPFVAIGTPSKRSKLEFILKYEDLCSRYITMSNLKKINWNNVIACNINPVDFSSIINEETCEFNKFLKRLKNEKS